LLDCYFTHR